MSEWHCDAWISDYKICDCAQYASMLFYSYDYLGTYCTKTKGERSLVTCQVSYENHGRHRKKKNITRHKSRKVGAFELRLKRGTEEGTIREVSAHGVKNALTWGMIDHTEGVVLRTWEAEKGSGVSNEARSHPGPLPWATRKGSWERVLAWAPLMQKAVVPVCSGKRLPIMRPTVFCSQIWSQVNGSQCRKGDQAMAARAPWLARKVYHKAT